MFKEKKKGVGGAKRLEQQWHKTAGESMSLICMTLLYKELKKYC